MEHIYTGSTKNGCEISLYHDLPHNKYAITLNVHGIKRVLQTIPETLGLGVAYREYNATFNKEVAICTI